MPQRRPGRVAGEPGHEAQHLAHVGRAGWKDCNIVRYVNEGDFTLVTNNASDFRPEPAQERVLPRCRTAMKLTPNEAMALAAMVRRAGMGAVLEELAQFARELAAARTLSIASSGLIVSNTIGSGKGGSVSVTVG